MNDWSPHYLKTSKPCSCDRLRGYTDIRNSIVELQFIQKEIDNIKKIDSKRHTAICERIHSPAYRNFFDTINSEDNAIFVESKVNGAKLVPIGGGKPGQGTSAQGAVRIPIYRNLQQGYS
jgi:hypothetical protein